MDNDQAQLLGEIHATVKAIDKRFDEHLEDYRRHKETLDKIKTRQVAVLAWVGGVGAAIGGSLQAFIAKLGF